MLARCDEDRRLIMEDKIARIVRMQREWRGIRQGKSTKKSRDGNTSQNISVDSAAICFTSLVSRYIHRMARKETRGTEARIAHARLLRLEISLTSTINPAEMSTFSR